MPPLGASYLRLLNVEVTTRGTPPQAGLLACNHLSYLDIVVLAGTNRQVFLSKAEVRNWPIIGALTRCAGTLFVRRERKSDVAELQTAFAEVVTQGLPITIFPEGTSSDGATVLPFFSALLEPGRQSELAGDAWLDRLPPRRRRRRRGRRHLLLARHYLRPAFLQIAFEENIYATVIFGDPIEPGLTANKWPPFSTKQSPR